MSHPSTLFSYPCNDNTQCYAYDIVLNPGYWKLECWGASGGDSYHSYLEQSFKGGKGGYSVGVIFVTEPEQFSLYIGGKGTSNYTSDTQGPFPGGFNGGGGGHIGGLHYPGGSGGGGTDIRRGGKDFDHRIIIAGGGGGAGASNANYDKNGGQYGGSGGGINGTDGGKYNEHDLYHNAQGAKGDKGGLKGQNTDVHQTGQDGSKGVGGSIDKIERIDSSGGGGGGGFYGGGSSHASGGGGGSGFIGGVFSYGTIESKTVSGIEEIPNPLDGIEIGHSGNGFIRITDLNTFIFVPSQKKILSFCLSFHTAIFVLFGKS